MGYFFCAFFILLSQNLFGMNNGYQEPSTYRGHAYQQTYEYINLPTDIKSLDFSTDGTMLATYAADDTIKVWKLNYNTMTLLDTISKESTCFSHYFKVAFIPNQNLIAFSRTTRIELYSLSEKKVIKTLYTNNNAIITSFAVSPHGTYLACGTKTGILHLWKLVNINEPGNQPELTPNHNGQLQHIHFSFDEKRVVFSSEHDSLEKSQIHESIVSLTLPSLTQEKELSLERSELVTGITYYNNSTIFFSTKKGFIKEWDISKDEISVFFGHKSHSIEILSYTKAKGQFVIKLDESGPLAASYFVSDNTIMELCKKIVAYPVKSAAFSHNGKHLALGLTNGNIMIFKHENPDFSIRN